MTPAALHEAMHALMREVTGKVILPRYQRLAAHEITAKAADDVVTVADEESEAMLAEGLARIAESCRPAKWAAVLSTSLRPCLVSSRSASVGAWGSASP